MSQAMLPPRSRDRAPRSALARTALLALALALAASACALHSAVARAEYTLPSLVSYSGDEQAEDADEPAISADGEYVAFTGTFDGVSGVYRKDLATGELALVAGEDSADPALSAPDAGAPSISGDGQYVSFTTTAHLDQADDQPGATGGCSSVYVRDMSIPAGSPGAYILASALNGTEAGLTYAGSSEPGCPGGGSAAAGRVALSEDGQQVAFTVIGESNLTTGSGGATTTAPGQVAVRDIAADTTTLVSQTMSSLGGTPEAVPGGGVYDEDEAAREPIGASTAAISADGSTVAWMGIDIPAQAPASSAPVAEGGDVPKFNHGEYVEPLWRRIADGPDAPTRRVTGGDDPLCGCEGPLATDFNPDGGEIGGSVYGPQYGTFIEDRTGEPKVLYPKLTPQLSADGQTVAMLSTAPYNDQLAELEAQHYDKGFGLSANAFLVNMATGLTRVQALTQLTESAGNGGAGEDEIESIAISPAGSQVAFTTRRTEFPLLPPALVTPALSASSEFSPQLYVANLAAGTLRLVSYGYDGEPANAAIGDPSFSGDGETLAFASGATNLVYGAYNKGDSNVFVTSQIGSPAVPGVTSITAPPADPLPAQSWELLLSTGQGTNGSVLLYVTVPGAGSLKALARAEVPVTVTTKAKTKAKQDATKKGKAKPHGKAKQAKAGSAAKRSKSAKRSKPAKHTTLATETVASASAVPAHAGMVALRLSAAKADSSLEQSHDGLYATITVTFAAPGHSTLTTTAQVTFKRAAPRLAKKTSKPAAKKASKKASKETSKKTSVRGRA